MTRLTLDDDFRRKLEGVNSCVELCDSHGNTLGYFTPVAARGPSSWEPKISEEELDRRERESETFSTAEVKAHLENL
jgi:hypothetical protein